MQDSVTFYCAIGVIHEIDETFNKPEGITFNTRKYMYGSNATHMVELFDQYDLNNYIDQSESNYTFLVPPHDAMNNSIISEPWLSYHIIGGSWPQENLKDNMLLASEFTSPDLGNKQQRLPVYVESEDKLVTVAGGRSVQFDHSRVVGENSKSHFNIVVQNVPIFNYYWLKPVHNYS